MTTRTAGALVGVLVAGVVIGTTAMWVDFNRKVDRATTEAASRPTPTTSASALPSEAPSQDPEVVSLWIGDGYTAGSGADSPQTGESCVAAESLGWTCELDAQRGTGFLSTGRSFDRSFDSLAGRLDELPPAEPDVVVVDAGRNDLGVYTSAAILAAMDEYLAALRERYPDATLVQVVPWWLSQQDTDPAMTKAVTQMMKRYDGYVVDPVALGWAGSGKTDLPSLSTDGIASQAGHDLIGAALADSLRDLDLPVPVADPQ